ncbi:Uncharacterised protein [Bordetella pertussis]|nr:Uncharacterised protein [Bordetella pertussis]
MQYGPGAADYGSNIEFKYSLLIFVVRFLNKKIQ